MKIDKKNYFTILGIALLILAIIFLIGSSVKFIIIVSSLIVIASLSTFYQNFLRSPINFELIKFSTILTAASYGFLTGLIVGLVSTIASKIISEKLDQSVIVSIIGIAVAAFAASMIGSGNIVAWGIGIVILYHLITAPMQMAMGGTLAYGAIYVVTNLAFNALIFSRLGPAIYGIM